MESEQTRALSAERGREIAAVALLFRLGESRAARVTTYDGDICEGTGFVALYDRVVLSGGWAARRHELDAANVARIARWELRLGRALAFGLVVTTLAATAGARWAPGAGFGELTRRDGALLGTIAGALLAALLVWLLQGVPSFHRWRVLLDEADDGAPTSRPAV